MIAHLQLRRTFLCRLLIGLGLATLVFGFVASQENKNHRGNVILVLSTECPACAKYTPRINELVSEYQKRGIRFEAIFPNEGETEKIVGKYCSERSHEFPWKLDPGAVRTKELAVDVVPAIVILDSNKRMVYRGAIDDNAVITQVRKRYAKDVLEKLAKGEKVTYSSVSPKGCYIMPGKLPRPSTSITYATHIGKMIHQHCTPCHRAGEAAPFSLNSYEDARKWGKNLNKVVQEGRMPPWKAAEGFGKFHDENRLSTEQKNWMDLWVNSGMPRGPIEREPKAPTFESGWALGKPDLVISASRSFRVPAEGNDVYRYFVIPTNLQRSVYISAIDVKPGNRKIVHHVIAFLDEKGVSKGLETKTQDGQPGYSGFGGPGFVPDNALGGWASGLRPRRLPADAGFELKPGTFIVLQVHYHLSGKAEDDLTTVGLYFSKTPVDHKVQIAWLANPFFRLKPGLADQKVRFSFPIPADVIAYGVMPHMHLLGKSMKATLILPDKTERPLVYIPDWDFNWQMNYSFKEPMKIPKGSKILIEAVYDNSAANPNQPNIPPKEVRWGEQTTDEMFLLVCMFSVLHP